MGVPVNGKHSIEVAVFVAVFQRPFSHRAIEALSGLQELLREDFPSFQRTNVFELRIDDTGTPSHHVGSEGVFLQKIRDDGKQACTLKVESNVVVVQCFEYETWVITSPIALRYLQAALNVLAEEENPIVMFALQVVDRFVEANREKYSIGQVFNKRSKYLSKHAIEAGYLWHVHQGWFEGSQVETSARLLNVLNLSTNDTPSGLITTIDHNVQFRSDGISVAIATNADRLSSIYDELHSKNKSVVGDLLNTKQRKSIKL